MIKPKSLLFSVIVLMLFAGCKNDNQKPGQLFHDKTFNWDMTIPKAYVRLSNEEIQEIKNDGRQLVAAPNDKVKFSNTLVGFKNNDTNIFVANYEEYLGAADMHGLMMRMKDALVIDKIYKFMPNVKVHYSIAKETISGLEFRKSKISVIENGKATMAYVIYSRLFKDKTFFAVMLYDQEYKAKGMIDVFRKSKFN